MNAPLVVLTNPIDAAMQAELERHAHACVLGSEPSADAIRAAVAQADAVIVRAPLPDNVFTHGPYLVGAVRHGAGVDMIPVDAATAAGVAVANVPGVNAVTVAESRDRTDAGAEPPPHASTPRCALRAGPPRARSPMVAAICTAARSASSAPVRSARRWRVSRASVWA